MSTSILPTTTSESVWESDFVYETEPNLTYKLHIDRDRISGYTDELEAYKQAVYKILQTERYDYIIYSWNYGIELKDLIGTHIAYAVPEIERRITEALMQDDRTESVDSFEFDTSKRGIVAVTFRANSNVGETKIETTVAI